MKKSMSYYKLSYVRNSVRTKNYDIGERRRVKMKVSLINYISAILSATLFSLVFNVAKAQSFDCSQAKTLTEIAICEDEYLSLLDELMAEKYRSAQFIIFKYYSINAFKEYKLSLAIPSVERMKDEQRQSLVTLNKCDGDRYCIKATQTKRIREMSESIDIATRIMETAGGLDSLTNQLADKSAVAKYPVDGDLLDAQKIISECWSISEKDRDSGVTSRMRSGSINTSICLKDQILLISIRLFENKYYLRQEMISDLEILSRITGRFYWGLYNQLNSCIPFCGTIYHTFHAVMIARMFEGILRDVVDQHNREINGNL